VAQYVETDIDAIYDAASHAVDTPKEAELPKVHSESVIASIKSLKRKATPVRIVHFVGKPKPQRVRAQALAADDGTAAIAGSGSRADVGTCPLRPLGEGGSAGAI
jgi:hypothetical protein